MGALQPCSPNVDVLFEHRALLPRSRGRRWRTPSLWMADKLRSPHHPHPRSHSACCEVGDGGGRHLRHLWLKRKLPCCGEAAASVPVAAPSRRMRYRILVRKKLSDTTLVRFRSSQLSAWHWTAAIVLKLPHEYPEASQDWMPMTGMPLEQTI